MLTRKKHRQFHFSDVEELHGNVPGIKFWWTVRTKYALDRNVYHREASTKIKGIVTHEYI
jgi:hypothetical protein